MSMRIDRTLDLPRPAAGREPRTGRSADSPDARGVAPPQPDGANPTAAGTAGQSATAPMNELSRAAAASHVGFAGLQGRNTALGRLEGFLRHLRELAQTAADGDLVADQRAGLDAEFQTTKEHMSRLGDAASLEPSAASGPDESAPDATAILGLADTGLVDESGERALAAVDRIDSAATQLERARDELEASVEELAPLRDLAAEAFAQVGGGTRELPDAAAAAELASSTAAEIGGGAKGAHGAPGGLSWEHVGGLLAG
jgi:hypothetical protein